MDRGSETQPQVTENLNKLTRQDKGQMIPQHVVSCASPSGTLFQPKIDRVQNRGTFLWTVIYQYSGNNQVENSFFRISNISVPCPHAQLRCRTVSKKLWTFSDLGVEIVLSHRHVEFFG